MTSIRRMFSKAIAIISFETYRRLLISLSLLFAISILILSSLLFSPSASASYARLGIAAGALSLLILPTLLIVGFRGSGREFVVCTLLWVLNLAAGIGASKSSSSSHLCLPSPSGHLETTTHRHCTELHALQALTFVLFAILLVYAVTLPAHAITKWSAAALINSVMPVSPHPAPPPPGSFAPPEGDAEEGKLSQDDIEAKGIADGEESPRDLDLAYEYVKRPRLGRREPASSGQSSTSGTSGL